MTASKDVIHPASPPNCGEEVNGIKAKCPIYVRAFFIGGAGDKTKYEVLGIPVDGPNGNIVPVQSAVDSKVIPEDVKNRYASFYLGFEEVKGTNDINTNVTANIPDSTTHVYIVGHSLGGWNGAHLSQILSDKGYSVKMLITLDPVGTAFLVQVNSDIYTRTPKPKAEYWMNILAAPRNRNSSDTVADLGGRWIIDSKTSPQPNTQHIVDINHAEAEVMFMANSPSSAYNTMVQSILETIRSGR
jgi:hypothetical protein